MAEDNKLIGILKYVILRVNKNLEKSIWILKFVGRLIEQIFFFFIIDIDKKNQKVLCDIIEKSIIFFSKVIILCYIL